MATDSADRACGLWPVLPALSLLPALRGADVLGVGAAGGVRFCSLSDRTQFQAGVTYRTARGAPGGSVGRRGAARPRGRGAPHLPDSSQRHMLGAGERCAPTNPPLSSSHSAASPFWVQLPCLTSGHSSLSHSVSLSSGTGTEGTDSARHPGGERGLRKEPAAVPGATSRRPRGPARAPVLTSVLRAGSVGRPAGQAGAGRCGGSVLQERGHAGAQGDPPGPAAPGPLPSPGALSPRVQSCRNHKIGSEKTPFLPC